MLELEKSNNIIRLNRTNNINNWQTSANYEFFVDFETYNVDKFIDEIVNGGCNDDLSDDFEPKNNTQKVYMIGVIYKNKYKCFVVNYIDSNKIKKNSLKKDITNYIFCRDERDLVNKFVEYIYSFKPFLMTNEYFMKNSRILHWSKAEPIIFKKLIKTYSLQDKKYELAWYDLYDVFKNQLIQFLLRIVMVLELNQL